MPGCYSVSIFQRLNKVSLAHVAFPGQHIDRVVNKEAIVTSGLDF